MSWISENIAAFITDVIGGFIELFGEALNNVFFWIVDEALNNVYVANAEKFIVATAIALISLMVVKIVTSGYMLETDYDSEADPFNLIIKIVETVAVITNSGWIFTWMLETSKIYVGEFLGSADTAGVTTTTQSLLAVDPVDLDLGYKWVTFVMLIAIIVVAFIVFMIVAGLRGAELIAMKLMMPYFALDLLSNSRERWNNFITAYIIAFFSYAFQILFFVIALKSYASISVTSSGNYYISTIVWMIIAIKSPKFLEKFIYRTGVSNAASSGLRMMAQTFVMKRTFA